MEVFNVSLTGGNPKLRGGYGSTPLHHPELVAGGVAESCVHAVRLVGGLLRELDAARRELLVAGPAVLGREEEPARSALGQQVEDLLPRLVVEDRRAGNGHQHDRNVLAGHTDGEPAEVPHLRHGRVLADLEAELVRVEGERLVLVVHPDLHVRELVQHGVPPCESMTPTTLVTRPCARLLESCCIPAGPTPGSGRWGSARARPQADT